MNRKEADAIGEAVLATSFGSGYRRETTRTFWLCLALAGGALGAAAAYFLGSLILVGAFVGVVGGAGVAGVVMLLWFRRTDA